MGGRGDGEEAGPAGEFGAGGIAPGEGDFPVAEDEGEGLGAGVFEEAPDRGVFGKGQGLLGEVEAFDGEAVLLGPGEVGREVDQGWIDVDAADAGAAAERRVEDLDGRAGEGGATGSGGSGSAIRPLRSAKGPRRPW